MKRFLVFLLPAAILFAGCRKESFVGPEPELNSVELLCEGVRYEPVGFCNSHYTFCLPDDADLTHITASFTATCANVTVNGIRQMSGETVNDFSKDVTYLLTAEDGQRKKFIVSAYDFDLPVIYIETPDCQSIDSREKWIADTRALVIDGNSTEVLTMSIKGRGNSTWKYPKKPYSLKLDEKREMFGMPKDKRWCLLADWRDRTLMRNAVALEIGRKCDGLGWTPKGVSVEVILNGEHKGCYFFCEQVKIGKNRVNIAEPGGYLMELDKHMDELHTFRSVIRNLPWMFKDPDELTPPQLSYMENYINEMENALYDDESFAAKKYLDYLDIASSIDYWFVFELTYNNEPTDPCHSVFFSKDTCGKLRMGPVWDFDRGTFQPLDGPLNTKAVYYERLFQDTGFKDSVKVRWNNTKGRLEDVFDFIDAKEKELAKTDVRNHTLWPITIKVGLNGDENLSFTDAVARLRSAYRQRLDWMDGYVNSL